MLAPRSGAMLWSLTISTAGAMLPSAPQPTGVLRLDKRQACPGGYNSCAARGDDFEALCCLNGWICTTDADGNPACCPSDTVCTGTIPSATGVSYVDNTIFPFPYISTSFANERACSSAVNQCNSNNDLCTAGLQGLGGYAVTISVPGVGGTTVSGGAGTMAATAARSICSSLSSEACFGINDGICTQTGNVGPFVVGSDAPPRSRLRIGAVVVGIGAAALFGPHL